MLSKLASWVAAGSLLSCFSPCLKLSMLSAAEEVVVPVIILYVDTAILMIFVIRITIKCTK